MGLKRENTNTIKGPAKKTKISTEASTKKKSKKSVNNSENANTKNPSNISQKTEKKEKTPKYEKPTPKNKNSVPNKSKDSNFSKKGKPNLDKIKDKKNNPSETQSDGKPNWLEYKKEQKELREKRRAKKLEDAYDVAVQAKQIGEKLRRSKLSPDAQEKLTKKLHDLLKTQYAKMIFAHDLSRVIQWQIKYCSKDIQLEIAEELKPHLLEMIFSKYAKNVVKTLVKRGTDNVKKSVLQVCNGKVVKLLSSVISSGLFEKLYVEVASEAEKLHFKQELYSDLYKKSKDSNVKSLEDTYKDSPAMKLAILNAVKANLIRILNKNLINSSLIHTVLYEFLSNCTKEDKVEITAMVRPLIAELSQTRDGAKAANLCIWHGTNKDRKLIMKSFKDHVKDITTSEHGYLMILALLDSVDDTVLLKKIILQEMMSNLNDIMSNEYGRLVLLYIVAHRDTHYFHPVLIDYLKQGDGNESSKKPAEIRQKEILECVIENLVENISNNTLAWLADGHTLLLTLATLKASPGDKLKPPFEAIAKFIVGIDSKLKKEDIETLAIEEPGLHMILKKLIQADRQRIEKNELTFGEVLVEHLTVDSIEHWINYNRGCFLLVTLIENESEQVISTLKTKLKNQNLKKKKTPGASILLKKLD